MLHRVAVGLFAVSSVAAHVTALPFPEMRIPTASLLVLAALLIVGQIRSWSMRFASGAAQIAAALSLAAVLLTVLAGTIGGRFHIDEPIQPVLWSLAGVALGGILLRIAPPPGRVSKDPIA